MTDPYLDWKADRDAEILAAKRMNESSCGLPSVVISPPPDADDARLAAFREARAKWVCPPNDSEWEKHLPAELMDLSQLWNLEAIKKITGYQFLGALVTGLGGNPKAVRACLGLQIADTRDILSRRDYMKLYHEAMEAIDREFGLDTPQGIYKALAWIQKNARSPNEAFRINAKMASFHGMVKQQLIVTQGRAVALSAEEQKQVMREALDNWLATAGRKALVSPENREFVRDGAAEAKEVVQGWQPDPARPSIGSASDGTSPSTGTPAPP